MLVTQENFSSVIEKLLLENEYGLDTETTGLEWSDRLFSVILATSKDVFYFNYAPYRGIVPLEKSSLQLLSFIFRDDATFFGSNIKFDMLMLMKEGLDLKGNFFCTVSQGRVFKNNLMKYSLEMWAEVLNEKKSNAVEEYIAKNGLYRSVSIPGKKLTVKKKFFDQVPLEVIQPYAEHDAYLHLKVGKYLQAKIKDMPNPSKVMPSNIMAMELELTKVCADMEFTGIKLDVNYTQRAVVHETKLMDEAKAEFKRLSGSLEFVDSPKALYEVFTTCGYKNIPLTEKGNYSFSDENLRVLGGPLADCVQKIRFYEKRIGTYYSSFLYFADEDGIIRPNLKQGGTETGRFSCSEPNLQNAPKKDEEEYQIRKCFTPREDYCFVMIDYAQQEYRMMLDYAGEHGIIKQVLDGADVHQAMATQVGIDRQKAKTLNFAVLYGASEVAVADLLKCTIPEAQELLSKYYLRLPKVRRFKRDVIEKGRLRGYVVNWAGRRCHISNPNWAYILPNHLIQGGCADVVKFSMVKIHKFLQGKRSRLLMCIHDELLFEIHKDELEIVPILKSLMENTYKAFNGMKLTTEVEHSWVSWGAPDKVKGEPNDNNDRYSNQIPRGNAQAQASNEGAYTRA